MILFKRNGVNIFDSVDEIDISVKNMSVTSNLDDSLEIIDSITKIDEIEIEFRQH